MNLLKNKISLLFCLFFSGYAALSFAESDDRNKPLQIEADRVTVDDINQSSTFEGSVVMRQGTLQIVAGKILVKQDKNGYSKLTATGQLAHFRQKRKGLNEYAEGYGERIEYDSFTEIANIYGQARVKREGDDVLGEHIVYNTKSGVFQVFGSSNANQQAPDKGRVTITIQPKSKVDEPAPETDPATTPPQPKQ